MQAQQNAARLSVCRTVAVAFLQSRVRNSEIADEWRNASLRLGALLPNSLLMACVQRDGDLDMLIRAMEDELSVEIGAGDDMFVGHYLLMLSGLWVGSVYETVRLLADRNRKLIDPTPAYTSLAKDLKLVRITLEKHELANERAEPVNMQTITLSADDEPRQYRYDKRDPKRAHILQAALSPRHSAQWFVTDPAENYKGYWIERRSIAERFLALWGAST
jgi:hypothetical protein